MVKIINTKDREKVETIRKFSVQLVNQGKVSEVLNWDTKSMWHNSKFTNLSNQSEWIVYLADHAWSGEVKVINTGNAS